MNSNDANVPSCLTSLAKLPRQSLFSVTLTFILLVGGFATTLAWFKTNNFYYTQFFHSGSPVFAYNFSRAVLALYVIWIIHASGFGFLSLFLPQTVRSQFTFSERLVLGFGTGLGCWHIFMFGLGLLNLYYPSIIAILCLLILAASTLHFRNMMHAFGVGYAHATRQPYKIPIVSGVVLALGLLWLFIVRGLYPSGGGDYYTHYFYYYTNVIANHGLSPNDVWYHYYYSKGAGLHFLGMLLMDPQAPSAMTFCSVAIAAVALLNLTTKWAARASLWPIFCAILYVLYNLVSLTREGGEFPKVHEETTAMVLFAIYAICMYTTKPKKWEKPSFIMLSALMIGAAILTQAVSVYFGFFFGLQVLLALYRRDKRRFVFYFLSGVIAATAVFSILLVNYLVTGLATDQAINLTWKFADLERLQAWGVLPNVMMVAWIRDNYDMVAVPWTFKTVAGQLVTFLRADALKIFFYSIALLAVLGFDKRLMSAGADKNQTDLRFKSALICVALLVLTFAVLSVFAGHSQAVSYYRFCSFFFPLLILLCTGICIFLSDRFTRSFSILPVFMLIAILVSWHGWFGDVRKATKQAFRFTKGTYSLADAYHHQQNGLPFGGINPGAYAAMQYVPAGQRVWSTNVDSYCMAPNCQIESTISFKMSPNLNEILSGKPDEAKSILQKEGLNYFLISNKSILLDLLPFSHLFAPNNIAKYLAIKWTNGETYLLTWRAPGTKTLDHAFIEMYKKLIVGAKHPWFRFNEAVPAMNNTMLKIAANPHPWKVVEFPWRNQHDQLSVIKIRHAAYGRNCLLANLLRDPRRLSANNATDAVKAFCEKKNRCHFAVNHVSLKRPDVGCSETFKVSYRCLPNTELHVLNVPGESFNKKINLDCSIES